MVTLMRAGIHPDWVSSREGYPRKNPISAHPGSARDPGGPSPVSTEARASSLRARATVDLWMAVEMWTTWSVSVGMRATHSTVAVFWKGFRYGVDPEKPGFHGHNI